MTLKKALAFGVVALFSTLAQATVTLSFSGTGARAIGFLDNGGAGVTGMRYGVVIDSGSDGLFASGNYASFNTAATVGAPVNIGLIGGGFSNDYFYTAASGNTTVASIGASGADNGGAGAIGSLTGVPTQSELQAALPGVFTGSSSYRFGIIWFDTSTAGGPYYGFYTDSSFVIPTAGPSVPFTTPFTGTSGPGDAPKSASFNFTGAAPIPEPSRMMLLGFGLVGLITRRRRK